MADKAAVVNRSVDGDHSVASAQWVLTSTDNTGIPIQLVDYADRSVQVTGTFGGAAIVIEGSNDGTTYNTLHDAQGNDLSFTAAGIKQVLEGVLHARPRITGGAGVNVTITMGLRKAASL